jgi:hypothetical protein
VVPAPAGDQRASYRRAIAAIQRGQLSDGEELTYQSRDQGDLVVSLVERSVPGPPMPQVVVPTKSTPTTRSSAPYWPIRTSLRSRKGPWIGRRESSRRWPRRS